jgi:hypothetical protein
MDYLMGVIAVALLVLVFCFGAALGLESAASSCESYGAFRISNAMYDCQPRAR